MTVFAFEIGPGFSPDIVTRNNCGLQTLRHVFSSRTKIAYWV